jgi:dihydrofolate reductase
VVDGPNGWDDTTCYGAGEVGKPAFIVVTSSPPKPVRLTGLDWTFVTTGLPDAVTAARERAEAAPSDSGRELDVVLMGGGATIGSALDAGLVDTLSLHLAPVVLGAGTPLLTGRAPRTLITIDAVTGWGVLAPGPRSGPVPARTAPGTSPRCAGVRVLAQVLWTRCGALLVTPPGGVHL